MRYAAIAAIPLALAISVPAYPIQRIQAPSEMQMAQGIESLEGLKRGLDTLLSLQSALQSYGGNLRESDSAFGKEYHDWAKFPSFEDGRKEHIISTFLTGRDNSLSGFTIFVDRINMQGYSNKPSNLIIFDKDYDSLTMHIGHKTLEDTSLGPNQLVNNFLASALDIARHLGSVRANAFTDGDLDTLVKTMETHEAALLRNYGGRINNKT